MSNVCELLELAEQAVVLAGNVINSMAGQNRTYSGKGDRDFATDVDLAVEDTVRKFLAKETPDYPLLGEEAGRGGGSPDATYEWVLDPVDGTVNFAHGSPLYSVSLALMHEGVPTAGVVAAPAFQETFSAATGHGATLNGRPIAASAAEALPVALVSLGDFAVGSAAAERNVERLDLVHRLVPQVQRLRMIGSAALDLCWVASGRLDAVVILSTHLWDIGAGVVIAKEAGAAVVDRYGNEATSDTQSVIACPEELRLPLLNLVNLGKSAGKAETRGDGP